MGIFKKDMENEMSGGQVFGYILVIGAILFIIAFGVFVGLKKAGIDTSRDTNETSNVISTTVDNTESPLEYENK